MSVSNRLPFVYVLLVSAAPVSACTHDFTGYHLESNGGASGAGANLAGDGAVSTGGTSQTSGGTSAAGHAGAGTALSGSAGADPTSAGAAGDDGGPTHAVPPSCSALPSTCGPDGSTSCCAASLVPAGKYDRSDESGALATLSAFTLDDYEVTVGRFRHFIAAYSQGMTLAGSGKNPSNQALDPGWNGAWNALLPATPAAFGTALLCPNGTFTPSAAANESEPITCVSWYEAYAFCIWDGGRLPTEAEWNFAAAGGSDERTYPWGTTVPDDTFAVFCPGSCGKMQAVGSKAPTGNGKFGQADLVGNAWEWNLDVFANPYAQASCDNCANAPADSNAARVFRGGSSGNDSSYLLSAGRYSRDPSDHNGFVGLRCARSP